jgi:predicted  nucleic acid-binding Zn-ribbon protein
VDDVCDHPLVRTAITHELDECGQHVRALVDQAQSLSEREVLAAGACVADMRKEAEGNVESLERVGRQFEPSNATRSSFDAALSRNAAAMQGHAERLRDGIVRQRPCTAAVTEVARKITTFVTGVGRVSVELRMLTLNARLEAARWGSSGAAFATVAASMHELTGEVSKANEQIGDLASELSAIARRVAENEKVMDGLAEGLTADVEDQTVTLSGAYEEMRRASADAVSSGIGRGRRLLELSDAVLTHLQFQDRMSQVLREAESVVTCAEEVTSSLLAVPGGTEEEVQRGIDEVLARATRPAIRISGESELASSDANLTSGAVELF